MSSGQTGGTAQSTTGPVATVMPQSYPGVDIETTEQTASVLAPPSAVGSADKNTTTSQTGTADVQAGGVAAVAKPESAPPATARAQEKPQTPAAAGSTLALAPPSVPATPAVVTPGTSSSDHPASQPKTVAKQATPAVSAKANITQDELNNLISRFVSAYKKGDVNKIMALFAPNARTNNRTTLDGIRADYIDLFKTTNFRDIAINSVFWEFDSQYARGVGEYRASVNPSGTNGSQTFLGKVTIQVSKRGNDLEMTRFYFSNQKVIAGTGSKPASSPLQASVAEISKIEMQNLMTRFISYYEKGDITGLMSLFAEDARTNDQATKAGISKDYLDLFNSTDSRQLTLSNMTWESKDGIASGSGHFEVVVKGKGSDVLNTFTGIIKIEAKRDKDHIVVTKWLHNTQ